MTRFALWSLRRRAAVALTGGAALAAAAAGVAGAAPVPALMTWSVSGASVASSDFGTVDAAAGHSASQTFSLANSGGVATGALTVTLQVTSGAAGGYAITADSCTGTSLGPTAAGAAKTCAVTVTYDPVVNDGLDTAVLHASATQAPSVEVALTATSRTPETVCATGCAYSDLQDAIDAVEAGSLGNPITLAPGVYTHKGNFVVTGTVAIVGAGDDPTTGTVLDGQNNGSVLIVNSAAGHLTLSGVDITHGASAGFGGGIDNSLGTVTLEGAVAVTDNTADVTSSGLGGGIANQGVLSFAAGSTITITDNGAFTGGGILNDGTMTFDDGSTVSIATNTARYGGGIANMKGTLLFATGSTVSITGNTATGGLGGGFESLGTVTYQSGSTLTISGNTLDNCYGICP